MNFFVSKARSNSLHSCPTFVDSCALLKRTASEQFVELLGKFSYLFKPSSFDLDVVFSTLFPDDRFTVASRTVEGDSAESEPSVAVRPNEPLPEGWKEKFNAATGKVEN